MPLKEFLKNNAFGLLALTIAVSGSALAAGTLVQIQVNSDLLSTTNPMPVTGTITTGAGVVGNGTAATAARVTIASDSTGIIALNAGSAIVGKVGIDQTTPGTTNLVAAGQNGTWTVQPGNTANTTPWLVAPTPAGGTAFSNYSGNVTTAGSGAGTGGVAVGSSGVRHLFGYQVYNGNSSVCYLQFLDQTQALTNLGTTVPVKSIGIPANGGANLISSIPMVTTATALTIGATTTRAGSTACSTGLDINLDYN